MTEKQYSSAKKQYEIFEQTNNKIKQKLDKGLASFLLKLPVPMSYEVWEHLHKIKGDDGMTETICLTCKYYRNSDNYCYYCGYGCIRNCKFYEKRQGDLE